MDILHLSADITSIMGEIHNSPAMSSERLFARKDFLTVRKERLDCEDFKKTLGTLPSINLPFNLNVLTRLFFSEPSLKLLLRFCLWDSVTIYLVILLTYY